MGTIFHQPERDYNKVTKDQIIKRILEIQNISKETKLNIDQVIKIYEIEQLNRYNDLYVSNGDIFDEQMSGIAFLIQKFAKTIITQFDNIKNSQLLDNENFDFRENFDLNDPATIEMFRKNWHIINDPIGKTLGYPDCCIKEFGDDAPELMLNSEPTEEHKLRYEAGCIDGVFTGFIPCVFHAKQILAGEITLASLIKDRNEFVPPFPDAQ
ncbi:MAG: hypothetical protein PHE56_08870 [Bacteroidales bacterium]|jgi:hypothetical protein|nr:hypothetical protein [Bacteroidales bacterium]